MGLENRIVYDICDVVEGKCKLRQALIKDKRFKELFLLPAAQTRDKSAVNEEQMIELTNKLREEFDFILLDCPAGIEQGFKNAIAGADRALVVTTAEISAIRDADRIIGLLATSQIKNPELIINRIRPNMIKRGEMMDVEDIVELLSIDLIGVIPDDEYIITQTNKGEPAVSNKKSPSGRGYMEIAQRLLGENIEITIPGRNNGFVSKLLDPRGSGYNVLQSKLAIGSGKLLGMGIKNGSQTQLGYLYPQTTDFIYSAAYFIDSTSLPNI